MAKNIPIDIFEGKLFIFHFMISMMIDQLLEIVMLPMHDGLESVVFTPTHDKLRYPHVYIE